MKSTGASSRNTGLAAGAQVQRYLASQPPVARRILKQMRAAIRAAAPDAIETFSYRIPGFKLDGRPLVYYAGFKAHASLYPMTAAIRRTYANDLEGYETSTGTVRFPLATPPSAALITRLVKARTSEVRGKTAGRR